MRIEKSIVVLDISVVVAGIFWRTDSYRCLVAATKRRFFIVRNDWIFAQYRRIATQLKAERKSPRDPEPVLTWVEQAAQKVDPLVLSQPISRDPTDDIFIATALAANASFVVTHDPDLLSLEKPFGIEMIRPREFLRKI